MAFEPTDEEGYIKLWKLIFPESYTNPIESEGDGEGQDIPAMMANIWSDIDHSMNGVTQSYFLKQHSVQTEEVSTGPTKASGYLEVRRVAPLYTGVTIAKGTIVQASSTDSGPIDAPIAKFVVTEDLTISVLGPLLLKIEAVLPGSAWNLEGTPVLEGYGKGVPDDPVPPFPGSAYTEAGKPTAWYRWGFIEGLAEDPTDTTISAGGAQISGDFNEDDIGLNVFVFTDPPQELDLPHRITGISSPENNAVLDPPLLVVGSATWRPATYEELGVTLLQDFAPGGDITGGSAATLEAIGSDRRIGRAPGQSDAQYRGQICNSPEIVTPNAIKGIIEGILDPCGVPWSFIEVLPPGVNVETPGLLMGFTWDVHPYDFGEVCTIDKPNDGDLVGQGQVFLPTQSRLFIICVDYVKIAKDTGLAYLDGPYPNAWDANFFDGNVGLFDPIFLTCIQQMWKAVNEARAAGVSFIIYLKNAP